MVAKLRVAVQVTAVGFGLTMDGLGVFELLGLGEVQILPKIEVNWPVVLILVGNSMLCWVVAWVSYGLWERRKSVRFQGLYEQIAPLRVAYPEGVREPGSKHFIQLDEDLMRVAAMLEDQFGIQCPSRSEILTSAWPTFLAMLTPLIATGKFREARRLLPDVRRGRIEALTPADDEIDHLGGRPE